MDELLENIHKLRVFRAICDCHKDVFNAYGNLLS